MGNIPSSTAPSPTPGDRERGRTISDDIAEAFHREHWRPNFTFPLEQLIRTYTLWVSSNGPCTLKLRGDVMAPFVEYKGVNIRIGSDNCKIERTGRPNTYANVLIIDAVLPNQAPGEWERRAGQMGMGSREFLRVHFSDDGSRIESSGSKFQRHAEGELPLHGEQVSVEEAPMLRTASGRAPTIPTYLPTSTTHRPQKKITHIRCKTGDLVDVIAFGYNDDTARCYGCLEGGSWSDIFGPLAEDEWVTEIKQRAGDSLDSVGFHTNKGRFLVFGSGTGGQSRNDIVLRENEYPGIVNIRREAGGRFCPKIVGCNEEVEHHAGEEGPAGRNADPRRLFTQVFGHLDEEEPRDEFDTSSESFFGDDDEEDDDDDDDEDGLEGPHYATAELSIEDQIRVAEVDECPICFESFVECGGNPNIHSNGQRVIKCITAECGHAFCKSCVLNLSAMQAPDYLGRCAVCRMQFSTRKLFYIYTNDQGGQELRLLME